MPENTTKTPEKRSIENPAVPLSQAGVLDFLSLSDQTDAGVIVNENTALESTAVWAAVQLLAGAVGMLPIDVFRKKGDTNEPTPNHPVARLLDLEVSPDMTVQIFCESLMLNVLLYGSGFAAIERDERMRPSTLLLLPSWATRLERTRTETVVITANPEGHGREITFPLIDVVHIPGLSANGLVGLSPVRKGRGAVGLALAAQQQAGTFFGNGSTPGGVLEHPGKLSEEAAKNLRTSWSDLHSGAKNAYRTAVLAEGMKFNPTSVPPAAAQLLESRKFAVTEVARIFGVPPWLLQDLERATFSNIESQGIAFVTYALNRWLRRWELELRRKLFREDEKRSHRVKFNSNALMRGDSDTRGKFYNLLLQNGVMNPNEVRALEDLNPYDGGDEYTRPLNMGPADQPDPPAPDLEEPDADAVRAAWLEDIRRRLSTREQQQITAQARKIFDRDDADPQVFQVWLSGWAVTFADEVERALTPCLAGESRSYADTYASGRTLAILRAAAQDEPREALAALYKDN